MAVQYGCSHVTLWILLVPSFRRPPSTRKLHYRVRYTTEAGSDLLHCSRTYNRVHMWRHKAFNPWCCRWRSGLLNIQHCCFNRILGYAAPQCCALTLWIKLFALFQLCLSHSEESLLLYLKGHSQPGSKQLRLNARRPNRCRRELLGHGRTRERMRGCRGMIMLKKY